MDITLNGKAKYVGDKRRLTHDEAVMLAFGPISDSATVTVTHYNRKTKRGGSLVSGESVAITKNTVLNVVRTDRA